MAIPVAASVGAGATAATPTTTVSPAYPASIAAGDLLVLHETLRDTSNTLNAITGWTQFGAAVVETNQTSRIMYKVASGSESGTLAVTATGNDTEFSAVIYRFTGVDTSGSIFEGYTSETAFVDTSIPDVGVTTTAADRLACNFYSIGINIAVAAATGQTGGTWVEAFAEYNSTGGGLCLQLQTANMASAATINGGATAIGVDTRTAVVFGLALLPGGGAATPQALSPSADSVDGTWTDSSGGTSLAAQLDETSASDTDYILSPQSPQDAGCRVKLAAGTDPALSTGHVIHWRTRKDAASGSQIDMTVKLYQGGGNVQGAGTLIATRTRSDVPGDGWTTYDETLSGGEADSITNYADLYLEFYADVP